MFEHDVSLGEAVETALHALYDMGLSRDRRADAHGVLWELARWQSVRAADEARLIFAEEVDALARSKRTT